MAGKWEDATSERQGGAGGGGSYKTLGVVLKTLDFIPSWIDAESFKWRRFQIRITFQSTFLTGFADRLQGTKAGKRYF